MICVGGPFAGSVIPDDSRIDWHFPLPGRTSLRPSATDIEEYHIHRTSYRREDVAFAWGNSARFEATAFVHESIRDERTIRLAVLSAFVAEMIQATAANQTRKA